MKIIFLDCTSPFEVSVVTDATQDGAAPTSSNGGMNFYTLIKLIFKIVIGLYVCMYLQILFVFIGVCLEYTQEPCAAGNPGP